MLASYTCWSRRRSRRRSRRERWFRRRTGAPRQGGSPAGARRLLGTSAQIPDFIEPQFTPLDLETRIRSDQTDEGQQAFSNERKYWQNFQNLRRNSGGNVWFMIFGGGAEQGSVAAAQGGEGTIF